MAFEVEKDWTTAAGLRAVVIMGDMGSRCGYVGVPVGHPLHGTQLQRRREPDALCVNPGTFPKAHAIVDFREGVRYQCLSHAGLSISDTCNSKGCYMPADTPSPNLEAIMSTRTYDPDSGVCDQDCKDLCPKLVAYGLASAIRGEFDFLGKPQSFWEEIILEHAQRLADEADEEEYERWSIKFMEA